MTFELELDRAIFHYVDPSDEQPEFATTEINVGTMSPKIRGFFIDLVKDIWNTQDNSVAPANFLSPEDGQSINETQELIQNLLNVPDKFYNASCNLAVRLHQARKGVPPGLLACFRFIDPQTGAAWVFVLKVRHDTQELIRLIDESPTEIEEEQVENVLINSIQKGACFPHPTRTDFQIKVIDKQTSNEVAQYFIEKFLQSTPKASDEFQIKNVVPTLEAFAESENFTFMAEKVPDFIRSVGAGAENITTNTVIKATKNTGLLTGEWQDEQLSSYIKKSRVGDINVPSRTFKQRQTKASTNRIVTYQFRGSGLNGLKVTGPVDIVESLIQADGDELTIRIQATRNNVSVKYT